MHTTLTEERKRLLDEVDFSPRHIPRKKTTGQKKAEGVGGEGGGQGESSAEEKKGAETGTRTGKEKEVNVDAATRKTGGTSTAAKKGKDKEEGRKKRGRGSNAKAPKKLAPRKKRKASSVEKGEGTEEKIGCPRKVEEEANDEKKQSDDEQAEDAASSPPKSPSSSGKKRATTRAHPCGSGRRKAVQTADELFESGFAALVTFKAQHGHTRINQRGRKQNQELTAFASWMRKEHKRGERVCLTPEREARLNALGFEWKVNSRRPRMKEDEVPVTVNGFKEGCAGVTTAAGEVDGDPRLV